MDSAQTMASGPDLRAALLNRLFPLLRCHSTPGDEGEVRAWLARDWAACGWRVRDHGGYAISAERPVREGRGRAPVLLVCAHMDSPGFIVDRFQGGRAGAVRLGGPVAGDDPVACVVRGRNGVHTPATLVRCNDEDSESFEVQVPVPDVPSLVCHGDRVCFAAEPCQEGDLVMSAFLDNRAGCALLSMLAAELGENECPCRVVLGATGCEEMGGFGAQVLARAVAPDLVVCLDATYEAPEQGVCLGKGPVLTLSDASVLLSVEVRDRVLAWAEANGLPLQTEVYNYSGTDARAFPQQGLPARVLPVLLPTRGNHTPVETASVADLESWFRFVLAFVLSPPDWETRVPGMVRV